MMLRKYNIISCTELLYLSKASVQLHQSSKFSCKCSDCKNWLHEIRLPEGYVLHLMMMIFFVQTAFKIKYWNLKLNLKLYLLLLLVAIHY